MSRNLKALGLALVAMLAMGAMAATAAQAEDEGRVVLDENTKGHIEESGTIFGTDAGEANKLEFTAFGGDTKCAVNEFEGEAASGTLTEVTVDTIFGGSNKQECTASGFPATVDNNECELHFDTFKTEIVDEEPTGTWEATVDLTCPDGKPGVVVTAFAGGSHGFLVCEITVPPQNGIERVVVHNNVNTTKPEPKKAHDLTLTADANNIKAHKDGLCVEGTEETATAQMHGEVTITAEDEGEESVDIYVEHHDE